MQGKNNSLQAESNCENYYEDVNDNEEHEGDKPLESESCEQAEAQGLKQSVKLNSLQSMKQRKPIEKRYEP